MLKITKTMACGLSPHGQIERKKVKAVADFIFLGSKITVNSDCSHEIKRRLLLRRKVMTNLFQSSDITLLTNVHIVKTVVFQSSCIDGRVGQSRKLSAKELMLSNCDAGETLESPLDSKEIKPVNPKC